MTEVDDQVYDVYDRTYEEAVTRGVERGVAFLDEQAPGWLDRVNLGTLEISDPQQCVLGQIFRAEAEAEGHPSGFAYALRKYNLYRWNSFQAGELRQQVWREKIVALRLERQKVSAPA